MIDEIKAAMAELEYAGIIERTGEMEWSERHHEWQPVTFTRNLDEHSPRPGSVSTSIQHEYQTSHRNHSVYTAAELGRLQDLAQTELPRPRSYHPAYDL